MEIVSLPSEETQLISASETEAIACPDLDTLTLDEVEGTSVSSAMSEATVVPETSDLTPLTDKPAPKSLEEENSIENLNEVNVQNDGNSDKTGFEDVKTDEDADVGENKKLFVRGEQISDLRF